MLKYLSLSKELQERIREERRSGTAQDFSCREEDALRRDPGRDRPSLWRPAYVRDVEKIMHCPFYNRYADKTQVFSFYRNDDISRRALHVQLVSRIARNIGGVLGLNLDLIEAIALGHDIGHTPFGHAGERFLNELYHSRTGRYFNHNVHSVRVLDTLFRRNLSLQTLDGILCHNGELEQKEYRPRPLGDFDDFDRRVEECYTDPEAVGRLVPNTLEGCVVRVCDMIAYLGKDRQDAEKANIPLSGDSFSDGAIGRHNAEIINNLTVSILENSYGKGYLSMDETAFRQLRQAKRENYSAIYRNGQVEAKYQESVRPMMEKIYERLAGDLKEGRTSSVIFTHHIDYIEQNRRHYSGGDDYLAASADDIVADYIASMTDDYFVELFRYLFPQSPLKIEYVSYFDD